MLSSREGKGVQDPGFSSQFRVLDTVTPQPFPGHTIIIPWEVLKPWHSLPPAAGLSPTLVNVLASGFTGLGQGNSTMV